MLEQINKVGRELDCNAPYKKTSPHTYVYVMHKFNVTKITLISSIDERGIYSDNELDGSENYRSPICVCVFLYLAMEHVGKNVRLWPDHNIRQEQCDPDYLSYGIDGYVFPHTHAHTHPSTQWCDLQQLSKGRPKILNESGGLLGGFHHVCHHEFILADLW